MKHKNNCMTLCFFKPYSVLFKKKKTVPGIEKKISL